MSRIHKLNEFTNINDTYFMKHHIVIQQKNKCIKESKSIVSAEDEYNNAIKKAEILLKDSKDEAEQIILNAREEAELLVEKIRQDAYEAGYEQGKIEGLNKFKDIIQQANDILKQMIDEKYSMITELEPEIMKVCINISEKILDQQIKLDSSKFTNMITNAIQRASDCENMNIYVSPEQYDGLNELKHTISSMVRKVKNIEVFKDETLNNLDCLIETDNEVIELGIPSQINKIEQALNLN